LSKLHSLVEKILSQLMKKGQLNGFTAKDFIELIKAKYEIINRILYNKNIDLSPMLEGDNSSNKSGINIENFNLTFSELNTKCNNLMVDLKKDVNTEMPISAVRELKRRDLILNESSNNKRKD